MRWLRKHACFEDAAASARLDEDELLVELNLVLDAETLIEVEEIDAAAQQDVLAVVDGLAANFVGSRASAQERPGLKKIDLVAGGSQCGVENLPMIMTEATRNLRAKRPS